MGLLWEYVLSTPMGAWGTHVLEIVLFEVLNLLIGSFISCLVKMASSYQMGKFHKKRIDIVKGLWFRVGGVCVLVMDPIYPF
jgi:hypothetical protein